MKKFTNLFEMKINSGMSYLFWECRFVSKPWSVHDISPHWPILVPLEGTQLSTIAFQDLPFWDCFDPKYMEQALNPWVPFLIELPLGVNTISTEL